MKTFLTILAAGLLVVVVYFWHSHRMQTWQAVADIQTRELREATATAFEYWDEQVFVSGLERRINHARSHAAEKPWFTDDTKFLYHIAEAHENLGDVKLRREISAEIKEEERAEEIQIAEEWNQTAEAITERLQDRSLSLAVMKNYVSNARSLLLKTPKGVNTQPLQDALEIHEEWRRVQNDQIDHQRHVNNWNDKARTYARTLAQEVWSESQKRYWRRLVIQHINNSPKGADREALLVALNEFDIKNPLIAQP